MSAPHKAAVFGVINSFGVLSAAVSQVAFGAVRARELGRRISGVGRTTRGRLGLLVSGRRE